MDIIHQQNAHIKGRNVVKRKLPCISYMTVELLKRYGSNL